MTEEKLEKIAILDNEVEARMLESILEERDIPHVFRSFYDVAFDGALQTSHGWGFVMAPVSYREEILGILEEIRDESDTGALP